MTINLRPWREENRQQRQTRFTQLSLATLVFSLLASLVLWQHTRAAIALTQQENQFLQQRLTQLNTKTQAVNQLREQGQRLQKHLAVIQQLQNSRTAVVELMQQLTHSMNDGVFLTELKRTETQLLLEGQANTSQAITQLMRSLNAQSRYAEPLLRSITNNDSTGLTHFILLIPLQEPIQ